MRAPYHTLTPLLRLRLNIWSVTRVVQNGDLSAGARGSWTDSDTILEFGLGLTQSYKTV